MAMPQGSSSHSTRSEVQAARRRTLEDEETGPSTSHPTIPNKKIQILPNCQYPMTWVNVD